MSNLYKTNQDSPVSAIEFFFTDIREKRQLINWYHFNPLFPDPNPDDKLNYCDTFKQLFGMWSPFINKGDLVLDIGANNGDTTLPLAHLAGETGCCVSFEPGKMFEALRLNKYANPNLNIEIHQLAITHKDGLFDFKYDHCYNNGGVYTNALMVGDFINPVRNVPGENLENFFKKQNINLEQVKFIKIDTEGFDLMILNSIPNILKHQPLLFIEWWCLTESLMIKFCKQFDYIAVNPYKFAEVEIKPTNRCHDLLLIPKDKKQRFSDLIKFKR
jgi:FkbM family methyltransferase